MPINQNHLFEDLNGIKCSIVEKNASPQRVDFLKSLLEHNRFTVVIVAGAPTKTNPIPAQGDPVADQKEESFTVGVTDLMFNPVNAIFGRLLKTTDGRTITLAYWQQKENESRDDIPYFSDK